MFQAHLVLFLPQSWNQPFLQRSLVIFGGKCIQKPKIWALGVLAILCEGGGRCSQTSCYISIYFTLARTGLLWRHPSNYVTLLWPHSCGSVNSNTPLLGHSHPCVTDSLILLGLQYLFRITSLGCNTPHQTTLHLLLSASSLAWPHLT